MVSHAYLVVNIAMFDTVRVSQVLIGRKSPAGHLRYVHALPVIVIRIH